MFSSILNNERRHKHECIVYPASKLMGQVLRVMQKYGYVGEFEKWGKRFLPSRDVGILILTTPKGVLAHKEAREAGAGGQLLGYVF